MRNTTWTNIGKEAVGTNVVDVLTNAGLNYEVVKKPIYTKFEDGNDILIPDRVATVRNDTNEILGVVSPRYVVCQNNDAFDFVNEVEGVQFERVGQTNTGLIYLIGKLPEVSVLGDTFTPYLIFQNGHNGRYTVKTTICPLRVVCQNQFNVAFRESANTISIQHSKQYAAKIAEAKKVITGTARYMQNFGNTAEELATLKIGNDADVKKIIEAFFKANEQTTERQLNNIIAERDELFRAYKADDNANFTGTVWGLVNGFSDFLTHKDAKNTKNRDENRFMTVTFDPRMFTAFTNHVMNFVR